VKIGERTVNNALFNTVSGMLPLVLSFIFWPYIVEKLGAASYGIFALVGSVIGYFALLNLGLGNAVIKYVAEYAGQQDDDRTQEVIGAALSIFMLAGLLGLLLILAIARVLVTTLLKIPPELIDTAYHAFCAASLGFFCTMLLTLFTSVVNGLNRYDISGITMAVMGMTTTIGAVLLLRSGLGLLALVWLNVAIPFAAILFYLILIRHLLPDISLRLKYRLSVMKRLLHFGMYAMLSRIADVILRQVGPLIIGAILGVTSVTYYVIPFTILNHLTVLIIRMGIVIFPAISELQGQQRHDTIRDLYLTSSRMILSFATAFTVPLLIFGPRFLHLWMSPEFAERGGTVLLIITAGIFVDQGTNVPTFVVNGLGRPKLSGLMSISRAVLFLGMMVPGAIYFGIIGVAAAFTFSNAIVSPVFIWFVTCKVLGLPLRQLMKEVYIRPLLAGIAVAIPLLFVPQAPIQNIFLLLLVMGGGMGLYFLLALLFGVYQKRERRVLIKYMAGILARFRFKEKSS